MKVSTDGIRPEFLLCTHFRHRPVERTLPMSDVEVDTTVLGLQDGRMYHWWGLLWVHNGAREAMVGVSVDVSLLEGSGRTEVLCRGDGEGGRGKGRRKEGGEKGGGEEEGEKGRGGRGVRGEGGEGGEGRGWEGETKGKEEKRRDTIPHTHTHTCISRGTQWNT